MPDDKLMLELQSLLKLAMTFLNRIKHGSFDEQKKHGSNWYQYILILMQETAVEYITGDRLPGVLMS